MKTEPKIKFSKILCDVCVLLDNAQKDYDWNLDKINEMDGLTQDYLHSLELDGLDYADRARLATKLKDCRIERREHKDTVQILEPLITFLQTDKGKQFQNLLRETLGKTRKVEERMANRVYYPRVLK